MRTDAKTALQTWLTEKIDGMLFDALTENPSSDRVVFAGSATDEAALTAADKFNTDIIGKAKSIATTDQLPKLVTLTQSEYDALTTKDENTYYFIKEA